MPLFVPSRKCPTVAEAVRVAVAGDKIFITPGRYEERLTLNKPITLVGDESGKYGSGKRGPVELTAVAVTAGALDVVSAQHSMRPSGKWHFSDEADPMHTISDMTVHMVHITLIGSAGKPTVEVFAGRVALESCTLAADEKAGLCVRVNALSGAHLERCTIGPAHIGVVCAGGKTTLVDSTVRHTAHAAVVCSEGASALVQRCALEGGRGVGVRSSGASEVHVADTKIGAYAIAGVELRAPMAGSVVGCAFSHEGTKLAGPACVLVGCSAAVRVTQSHFQGIGSTGIEVYASVDAERPPTGERPGSQSSAAHEVAEPPELPPGLGEAAPAAEGGEGGDGGAGGAGGAGAQGGSAGGGPLVMRGALVERNTILGCRVGILCAGAGPLQPALRANSVGTCALAGVELSRGSEALLERCELSRCVQVGVLAQGGARPIVRHNTIRSCTQHGVELCHAAAATLAANVIRANGGAGVLVRGSRTRASLRANELTANHGPGVELRGGASAHVTDNAMKDGRLSGMLVGEGCTALIARNVIAGNGRGGAHRSRGRHKVHSDADAAGIVVKSGAAPVIEGNTVSRNAGAGVFVEHSAGGRITSNTFTLNALESVRLRPDTFTALRHNVEAEEDGHERPLSAEVAQRARELQLASAQEEAERGAGAPGADGDDDDAWAELAEAAGLRPASAVVKPAPRTPFDHTFRAPHGSDVPVLTRAADVRARYEALKGDKELAWLMELSADAKPAAGAPAAEGGGLEPGSAACAVQ